MQRKPVKSSTIEEIGYDIGTRTLEIKFRSGRVYQFEEVPVTTFTSLAASDSPGGYFLAMIRPFFICTHLNPTPQEAERAKKRKANPSKKETAKALGIKET